MSEKPPTTDWTRRVQELLRDLAGDWVDEAAAEWTAFDARPLPRLTVHGPYSAGKSSLLKRILIADGTPVPDWLRIGAAPTSASLEYVDSGGLTWVDTPGTAAGDEQHDALADTALGLTDAVLVVLPPQLLVGDTARVLGLIDGTFHNPFAQQPLFPAGALVIAVARMDSAGVDAVDDLDGYRKLGDRKRKELHAAVQRANADLPAESVFLVAADPDTVSRYPQTEPEDYAGNEKWDGVDALRTALGELPARRSVLRDAAAVRYWSWIGAQAHHRATAELNQLSTVVGAARSQQKEADLHLAELRALDDAARTRLHEMLRTSLLSPGPSSDGRDGQRARLEEQLGATIDIWLGEWAGKLEQLARAAATEQRVRTERPSAAELRRYLDDLAATPIPEPTTGRGAHSLFDGFHQHAKTAARNTFTLIQGFSPDDAHAELLRLRNLTAAELDKYFTGPNALLTSTAHASQVRRNLRRLEVAEQLLPLVLELGGMVAGRLAETHAEQRRIDLRAQLREQADRIAQHVLDGGEDLQSWSAAVDVVRQSLTATRQQADTAVQAQARKQTVEKTLGTLEAVLAAPPRPDARC
ncbi:hypothetical protein ACWED2_09495 [Amycolatopsis sp. NPDC005003]